MLPFDQTLSKDIPSWTFFAASILLFVYQNCDSIDGKHARRTNSSSPLGQLFDHGSDSFGITFLISIGCQAAKFGDDLDGVFFLIASVFFTFWMANWTEYRTKLYRTHLFNVGVAEGLLVINGIMLTAGIFGQDIWATPLEELLPRFAGALLARDWLRISIKFYVFYGCGVLCIIIGLLMFLSTIGKVKNRLEGILESAPVFLLIGLNYFWKSTDIYASSRSIVNLTFGLNFSMLVCRIIVCSLTDMKFPLYHREIIFFGFATLLLRRDLLPLPTMQFGFDFDKGILVVSFFFALLSVFQWIFQIIHEMTSHLGIYCYSLQKKPRVKLD